MANSITRIEALTFSVFDTPPEAGLRVVDNGLDGHWVAPVRFGFAMLARDGTKTSTARMEISS